MSDDNPIRSGISRELDDIANAVDHAADRLVYVAQFADARNPRRVGTAEVVRGDLRSMKARLHKWAQVTAGWDA